MFFLLYIKHIFKTLEIFSGGGVCIKNIFERDSMDCYDCTYRLEGMWPSWLKMLANINTPKKNSNIW